MKIGIDARLYGETGIGRYISNLLRQLEIIDKKNEYIIFVTKEGSNQYHPKNPNFKKWISDYSAYSIQEQTMFLIDLHRARLDLLHVPHFNVPILYFKRYLVTIHDLTMHEYRDSSDGSLSGTVSWVKRLAYLLVFAVVKIRAINVIVPSNTVKSELVDVLKFDESKIIITTEGVESGLIELASEEIKNITPRLEQMGIKHKYFLYVGSAYIHKNLKTMIVAYNSLVKKMNYTVQLVIAGKVDRFSQSLAAFSHGLRLDNLVIYAAKYSEGDYIPEEDLAYLYRGAFAYITPSLKEGFSITPIEAQAFNVPVLASDIPTHREVLGESALYFDPNSAGDITDNMRTILTEGDLREALITNGALNIKQYSWESMAKKTLEVYEKIFSGASSGD